MSELLKINGVVVDIPDNGINIGLNFESNLLSLADGVRSSWSNSVNLPKTLRNDAILNYCDKLNYVGRGAHHYYSAEYYQNGLLTIKGKLRIISTDNDSYKCSIFWGFDGLEAIKAKDAKLNTLIPREEIFIKLHPYLQHTPKYTFLSDGYGYVGYDSGVWDYITHQNNLPYNLPAVTVGWLMRRIKEKYNVSLEMPLTVPDVYNTAILLTSNKIALTDSVRTSFIFKKEMRGDPSRWYYEFSERGYSGMLYTQDEGIRSAKKGKVNYKLHAEGGKTFFVSIFGNVYEAGFDGARWVLDLDIQNKEIEDEYIFNPVLGTDYPDGTNSYLASLDVSVEFTLFPKNNTNTLNNGYSLGVNLPDMNCFDFLKNICVIAGVSMVSASENNGATVIKCLSWDSNLIATPATLHDARITGCAFDDGNVSQNNRIAFATPKKGTADEGVIISEDVTMTPQKDWFISAFALVEKNRSANLYSIDNDGKVSTLDTPPFICALSDSEIYAQAEQGWLSFNDLTSRYNTFINAVKKLTIITVTMPVQEIDTTKAVYEQTTAQRYAVLKIFRTGNSDQMQATLLKL